MAEGNSYVFCMPDVWVPETGTLYVGKCYIYNYGGSSTTTQITPHEPIEFGLGGSIDCPNPQTPQNGSNVTASSALQHYIGGTGKDLNMSIKELYVEVPNLGAFPDVANKIRNGTTKPFEQISISKSTTGPIPTSGPHAPLLGRITFNLTGVLNLYMTGDFQFYGSIGVNPDPYDFDKDKAKGGNRRTSAGQASTQIGSLIPGKSFNININGRFSLDVSGNGDNVSSYSCK